MSDARDKPAVLGEYAVQLATGAADLVRSLDSRGPGSGSGSDVDAGANSRSAFLDVHSKSSSTDLVTAVDKAVEQWLVEQLGRDRAGDAVLGEENGARDGSTPVRWLLDPIDGTVNFVLGLPYYAVSVAAEVGGQVVAGAVCNPVTGEVFRATLGGGAWLGARRLRGPRVVELARAVVGTGFGYDRALRGRQAAVVSELLPRVADIRRIGSAALDICAVACGRLDAYYEVGLNPWDYGAAALVAAEAGCVVSGLRGEAVSPRMAVAAGPALGADLLALLVALEADRIDGR